MKPPSLLFVTFCWGASLAKAASLELEIRHLVSSEVEHLVDVGQALEGRWVLSGQGGYILRAQVDFTGDGKPELLLGTTMSGFRGSTTWKVYDQAADGGLRTYAETMVGGIGSYRPARNQAGEFVLLDYDRHNRSLAVLKFNDGRLERHFVSDAASELLDDENQFYYEHETKWPYQPFLVEALKLSDYVAGGNSWKVIKPEEVKMHEEGYFLSAADAAEMKANKVFTPHVALEMLRRLPLPAAAGTSGGPGLPSDGSPGAVLPAGRNSSVGTASVFSSAYAGLWAGLGLLVAAAVLWLRKAKGGRGQSTKKSHS